MHERNDNQRGLDVGSGPSLRQIAVILGLVFAVALAVVVGKKMSAEAMAVVIGVICGIIAAVPTSVVLLVALTREGRRQQHDDWDPGRHTERSYPPVVVIQGGAPQALQQPPGYWPAPSIGAGAERETIDGYRVLGQD